MTKPAAYIIIAALAVITLAGLAHWLRSPPEATPFTFQVRGESMLPTLRPGDLVYAEQVTFEDIGRGWIVTTTGGVVHRTVERNHIGWALLGDNNPSSDRWTMTRKDYEGTVLYWQNALGEIITPEYAEEYLR
jgi:signal peptidase I